jgi:hypothetical protein
MTNLKWLRQALLGGAALGVLASGAQADELSALKAQLEALQARVNQLETTPAPALPPGTKLLTVRNGQGTHALNKLPMRATDQLREHQGYTIAITPTADMPAPVSEIEVSGEIRARLLYSDVEIDGDTGSYIDLDADDNIGALEDADDDDVDGDDELVGFDENDFNITTRARLNVQGHTETAIGEVGGRIRLQGTDGGDVTLNIGWGYWQMTPNLQFAGGYWDSLAAVQAGWDWNGDAALVGLDSGITNQSVSQFRLTYSDGGLTLAGSVEDNDEGDIPAIAGTIIFDSGSFLVTASAIWEEEDEDSFVDTDDNWFVGAGAVIRLSDMFRLEGAAGIGEGYEHASYVPEVDDENDFEYWGANVMAVVSFAEAMRVELGFAYSDVDHEADELVNEADAVDHSWSAGATLFWDPVDQLTLGWGVGFTHKESEDEDAEYDSINAGFGAWFRF